MTTFIAYYIIFNIIMKCLFKRDTSFVLCGMAGVSMYKNLTAAQLQTVKNKMRILGLYNETRGVQGCGWYINGEVLRGYDDTQAKIDTKKFYQFLIHNQIPDFDLKKTSVSFLHCRQASSGGVSKNNTHPFYVETPEKNIFLTHNGTIRNIWKLCTDYKVPHAQIHVDSLALGHLLARGHYDVLNKYEGAAALFWMEENDPESLYVYHGSSIQSYNTEKLEEERPMYFMHTKEGIYFSSIANSLEAIKDTANQKVECLNHNIIFQVKHGKFTPFRHIVERCKNIDYTTYSYNNYGSGGNYNSSSTTKSTSTTQKTEKTIWYEQLPWNHDKSDLQVFLWKGRYWTKGVDEYELLNGVHKITDKGEITTNNSYIDYYFYRGVRLWSQKDYEACLILGDEWLNSKKGFAYEISYHAAHPVCCLSNESVHVDFFERRKWFKDKNAHFTGSYNFKWSSRSYIFNNSKLVDVTSSVKEIGPLILCSELPNKFKKPILIGFPEPKKEEKKDKISYMSLNENFNNIYNDQKELEFILEDCELYAVLEMAKETLQLTHPYKIDNEDIIEFANTKILDAISKKKSLSEIFEDKEDNLNTYAVWAKDGCIDEELYVEFFKTKSPVKNHVVDMEALANNDNFEEIDVEEIDLKDNGPIIMTEAISFIEDLRTCADELQEIDNSEIAQELANLTYRAIDNLVSSYSDAIDGLRGQDYDNYRKLVKNLNNIVRHAGY